MKLKYQHIIETKIFHEYGMGELYNGLKILPTSDTEFLLSTLNWIYRPTLNGFKIFAQVDPQIMPFELYQTDRLPNLKLSFYVGIIDKVFINYTNVAIESLGRELIYFSNLRDEQSNGKKLLGDQIVDQNIGYPVKLITGNKINYRFNTPVNSAVISLNDIFNNSYSFPDQQFTLPNPADTVTQYSIDLNQIEPMPVGRIKLSDNHGGEQWYYYQPDLFNKSVFAVIEIFNSTTQFTNPSQELVPVDYQFLNDNQLTGNGNYAIQFESRSADWKYIVRKKPGTENGIDLNNLNITGDIAFPGNPDMIDDTAVFRSVNSVLIQKESYTVNLNHNGTSLFKLPNPSPGSLIQEDMDGDYYEINVYV